MKTIESMRADLRKYLETADEETIRMVHEFLDADSDQINLDAMPDEVRANVLAGLEESENGELIPDLEIQKRVQKWVVK